MGFNLYINYKVMGFNLYINYKVMDFNLYINYKVMGFNMRTVRSCHLVAIDFVNYFSLYMYLPQHPQILKLICIL
jgi:hypothetical protein